MSKFSPSVRLLFWLREAEKVITASAKATLSPRDLVDIVENYTNDDVENWVRELITRGHGSPLEHSLYIFEIVCSRVCSHQLVRHRHASYSQLSQRYSDKYLRGLLVKACEHIGCEYREDYRYYIDILDELAVSQLDFDTLLDIIGEAYILPQVIVEKRDKALLKILLESTRRYYEALVKGVSYEDARYLLPQAVKTRVIMSMNARELVEVFLPLRMCTRAQWEIRMLAWGIWKQLMEIHPLVFKYTGPRCVFMENRIRENPCSLVDYLEERCDFTVERCPEKRPRGEIKQCIRKACSKINLYKNNPKTRV
ncbi:MAG: FAD-dependent thymidylate synthase [Desulfurococcaceae archaeon]